MNGSAQNITASMEDYLEAIYHICREHKVARAKQIASRMDVAMSSVTGALKHLAQHSLAGGLVAGQGVEPVEEHRPYHAAARAG